MRTLVLGTNYGDKAGGRREDAVMGREGLSHIT